MVGHMSPTRRSNDSRLGRARLYACVDARGEQGDLPEFLDVILAGGVDIVQLRDKSISVAQEIAALGIVRERCEAHGALWAVNDRVDIACAVGAPVVHLGQTDMPVDIARSLLGPEVVIGRSTHSLAQAADAAQNPDVDYFAVGPIWATPTKPGRPAVGVDLIAEVASAAWSMQKPWFAIGGIDATTIAEVTTAGASRAVVVRALTTAQQPGGVASDLRDALMRAGDIR